MQVHEVMLKIQRAAASGDSLVFGAASDEGDSCEVEGTLRAEGADEGDNAPGASFASSQAVPLRTDNAADIVDLGSLRNLVFVDLFIALGPCVRIAVSGVVSGFGSDYSFPKSPELSKKFGIIGAVIGGFIMRAFGFAGEGGLLYTILVAVGGAVLLTLVVRLFTGTKSSV